MPNTLIMAVARQTWDEVRHAWLAKGLVESYGGRVELVDLVAGRSTTNIIRKLSGS